MDDNSKASEEDVSLVNSADIEDISKLKNEIFHLRLRCYNLEVQLGSCNCDKIKSDDTDSLFDHREQLDKVVQSHQEIKWENEKLKEDYRILKETCGDINDDFEKKLSGYESLKMKYDQLTMIADKDGSIPSAVKKLMKDTDSLIKDNVERKMKIRQLEKKLADMNNSFVEGESQRRKSLTQSLTRIIKASTDTSFRNSHVCLQCDELKVNYDKLSETLIKLTVDFQGINKTMEQKNIQIADLDNQILILKSKPDVDNEQLNKYKVITKQCIRKYAQEKKSLEETEKNFDELYEYQMKVQGALQDELETLRKDKIDESVRIMEETKKIGDLFVRKYSEVQEANEQINFVMKSSNMSHSYVTDYDKVGTYSPQYKIRPDQLGNSSLISDSDSVYYDKNISLNNTLFNKSKLDESSVFESNINDVVGNMQLKVRELGDVVQSYLTMMKDEHNQSLGAKKNMSSQAMSDHTCSDNSSLCINEKTENNDSQISLKDETYLKRIYEEEKQRFDHLLEEKVLTIEKLQKEIELLHQEKVVSDSNHRLSMDKMSTEYSDTVAKYHHKVELLIEEKEGLQKSNAKKRDEITKLEVARKELDGQLAEVHENYDHNIKELENLIMELRKENFEAKEMIIIVNNNLQTKMSQMEHIFTKVRTIIEENFLVVDGDNDTVNLSQLWRMLLLLESCLREKANVVETASKNLSTPSWSTSEEDVGSFAHLENNLANKENRSYTSSLNFRGPGSMSDQSECNLHELTNVTDLNDEQLPEIPIIDEIDTKDKFKYIRENPEKIHRKMKYFYELCERLKKVATREHEENKQLKRNFSTSVCQAIDEMTRKIDDFKRQLDMCKACLVRSQSSLPDAVAQELKQLNLL